ncbi:MAG: hypothetical protein ACC651_15885 [Candidatus Scalindua sp.]
MPGIDLSPHARSNADPAITPDQNTMGQNSGSVVLSLKSLPSDITARETKPINTNAAITDKRKLVVSIGLGIPTKVSMTSNV